MSKIYIKKAGICAPGLENWTTAAPVLRGEHSYEYRELGDIKPDIMPKSLMRRTTRHIRLAIEAAAQALPDDMDDCDNLSCVFASSENDGETAHMMCEEVILEEPGVSPMRFHNSVSNAAVGNLCISLKKQMPSTSISAYDQTLSMAIIETIGQLMQDERDVLLVVHDTLCEEPLFSLRPGVTDFSAALLCSNKPADDVLITFDVSLGESRGVTKMEDLNLECIRDGNPVALALPLLEAVACGKQGRIELPYSENQSLIVTCS